MLHKGASPTIRFFFYGVTGILKHRRVLKKFITSIFQKERKRLDELNVIFCSDRILRNINRRYLHHDFYTDIVTFEFSSIADNRTGEIYISLERVKKNARIYGTTQTSELHRVIFHGVFHLCGYNDQSKAEKKQMTQKEDLALRAYFQTFHVKQ